MHDSGAAVKNKTWKGTTGGDDGAFSWGANTGLVPRIALVTSAWGERVLVQNGADTIGECDLEGVEVILVPMLGIPCHIDRAFFDTVFLGRSQDIACQVCGVNMDQDETIVELVLGIICHIWNVKTLYRTNCFFDTNFLGPSEDNAKVIIVKHIIFRSSTSFSKALTKKTGMQFNVSALIGFHMSVLSFRF